MNRTRILASAAVFVSGLAAFLLPAHAAATDYRFELVGAPQIADQQDVVEIRLVHVTDGKPASDAVIFESTAAMEASGMPAMPAPVTALSTKDGVYSFAVNPVMAGTYALHLAAKVQGETETIRGSVNANLVN
jgi:hypothetical protein